MYGAIYCYGRIAHWKALYEQSEDDFEEVLVRATKAERAAQATTDKYVAITELIKAQMERPVVCALTETQIQTIASVLSQLVMVNQGVNRLN